MASAKEEPNEEPKKEPSHSEKEPISGPKKALIV